MTETNLDIDRPDVAAGNSDKPTGRQEQPEIIWSNVVFFSTWTLLTLVAVPWYALKFGVTWMEIGALVLLWCATGLGITAGYHRLFSHRAYEAIPFVRAAFALFGGASFQSSAITWSALHRTHHRHVDTDDDPYNARRGFWYSHIGWLVMGDFSRPDYSAVPDLWKDPICRWQHRHYIASAVAVNALMVLVLGLLTGRMLGMVVFALLLRVLLWQHMTWLINSVAHIWGGQPYSRGHTAKDNWFLSLLTFGEGYHNYHHTFQADYRNGPKWYNFDPTKWLIWIMARFGMAKRLRRIPAHVTLAKRFEKARQDLEQRLAALDLRVRVALRERIETAQTRCEDSLAELEVARKRLLAAAPDEARRLRRSVRRAHRTARHALDTWHDIAYGALMELTPA